MNSRKRMVAGGLFVLAHGMWGCGPAMPAEDQGAPIAVKIGGEDEISTDTAALWRRLGKDKLEGLALVPADVVLFSTAAEAKAAKPKRRVHDKPTRTVVILANEGDVVKVRTWHSRRVRDEQRELTDYDLTLYAARSQLVPTIRKSFSMQHEDGTGYMLFEGFPLRITSSVEPGEDWFADVPVQIPGDHVGLSFPLQGEDGTLPDLDEQVLCVVEARAPRSRYDPVKLDDEPRPFRIVSLKSEQDRRSAEARRKRERRRRDDDEPLSVTGGGFDLHDFGKGGFGFGFDSQCGIDDTAKVSFAGVRAAPGGDSADGSYAMFRGHGNGSFLFDLRKHRAQVRFAVPKTALRAVGGGGGVAMLGGGGWGRGAQPPPPKIWAVVGKQKAFFESGLLAGYHMSGTTKLRKAAQQGKRLCIEHPNVNGKLCFDKSELKRVDDR